MRPRKMSCNDLIFKEVHPVPLLINLDVTGHEKPSRCDEKLSSYTTFLEQCAFGTVCIWRVQINPYLHTIVKMKI